MAWVAPGMNLTGRLSPRSMFDPVAAKGNRKENLSGNVGTVKSLPPVDIFKWQFLRVSLHTLESSSVLR